MPQTTPFDQIHRTLGARFDTFDGWSLPADFGDTEAETAAMNSQCAAVDLCSFGRIQLRGSNVKEYVKTLFIEKSGFVERS